jgi:chitin disaccharide deacetylase
MRDRLKPWLTTLLGLLLWPWAGWSGFAQSPTVAERLGYPRDAKLLIIHADDLAVAHSVDLASFRALEEHQVSSASVMVPCPWFPDVVDYARQHPQADIGLHLTLNSEWKPYRWGPQAPRDQVKSLLDPDGYLWSDSPFTVEHGQATDVEWEIRSQIDQAMRMGLHPTHVDDHQGTIESRQDFYAVLVKVAHEYHLPFRSSRPDLETKGWAAMVSPNDIILDRFLEPDYHVPPDQWMASYLRMLDRVVPGLNEMIVHLGYDDPELQAITVVNPGWDAKWRQRDFDLVGNPAFKEALRNRNIIVIGWRELDKLVP